MVTRHKMNMDSDLANKRLIITRVFDAPVEKVWQAWTDKDILDQWWAPKPYNAETKSMSFKPGGQWLYAMVGPDEFKQWCKIEYKEVTKNKSFTGDNMFCDEKGNRKVEFPSMDWKVSFQPAGDSTKVTVEITFGSEKDLKTILEMGFEEGFASAQNNLDELL